VLRDRPFLVLLVSYLLASAVYIVYETVLPVVAVSDYALAASAWGVLLAINPVLVTLLQLRVTARTARYGAGSRLVVAMGLMGGSFLLLLWSTGIPMLFVVLVVFVFGEMLWAPTSQALAARLAPARLRGAYMGAYGIGGSVAFMLGPFGFLYVRSAGGATALWLTVVGVSTLAAVGGVVAARAAGERASSS
jgi:MFS family permease